MSSAALRACTLQGTNLGQLEPSTLESCSPHARCSSAGARPAAGALSPCATCRPGHPLHLGSSCTWSHELPMVDVMRPRPGHARHLTAGTRPELQRAPMRPPSRLSLRLPADQLAEGQGRHPHPLTGPSWGVKACGYGEPHSSSVFGVRKPFPLFRFSGQQTAAGSGQALAAQIGRESGANLLIRLSGTARFSKGSKTAEKSLNSRFLPPERATLTWWGSMVRVHSRLPKSTT